MEKRPRRREMWSELSKAHVFLVYRKRQREMRTKIMLTKFRVGILNLCKPCLRSLFGYCS